MDISSLIQWERLWGLCYEPGHTSQTSGLQAAGDLPVPKMEVLKQQRPPQRLLTCAQREAAWSWGPELLLMLQPMQGGLWAPAIPLCPLLLQPGRGCICSAEPDTKLMLRVIEQ